MLWLAPASAAVDKTPPACASIAFHPVPAGLTDGQQDAGLYKSRFGRIEVKTNVKGGEAQGYFVEINGKPLAPVSGALPAAVVACAKVKGLTAPNRPLQPCVGDRLVVLIGHNADDRYILLYGRSGGAPRFCSAGLAP
jgi:hypothetical protein